MNGDLRLKAEGGKEGCENKIGSLALKF